MTYARKEQLSDGVTLYQGDCREILPTLGKVDAVVTDPPYGIGAGMMNFGKWASAALKRSEWDSSPPEDALIAQILMAGNQVIVWGSNYFQLPPSRAFLVWDKGAGFRGRDFAEAEQAWCSWDGNARIYSRDPLASGDYKERYHKTQKPVALMAWCIRCLPGASENYSTILDPFMGSGTTGVACVQLGRKFIGIELEPRYFDIAVKRISDELKRPRLPLDEKPAAPVQEAMPL